MAKKTIILLVIYFLRFFWPLEARAARKKIAGARVAWGKKQEPESLEKKSGARATKKFAGSRQNY